MVFLLTSGFEPRAYSRAARIRRQICGAISCGALRLFGFARCSAASRAVRRLCAVTAPYGSLGMCGEDAKANGTPRHSAHAPQCGLRAPIRAEYRARSEPGGQQEETASMDGALRRKSARARAGIPRGAARLGV